MRYLLIGFLLLAPAAYPQSSPAPAASNPQAITLAGQALAALTGSIQVNDVTLTGTGTRTAGSDVESGSVSLKALASGEARVDLTVVGGTRSEIRNLDSNSSPQGFWIGLDGNVHSMATQNCVTDAAWFFPALSILSQLSNPRVVATYIGKESKNGASVQHLHFIVQSGDPSGFMLQLSAEDVYLDTSSKLPVAIAFSTHPDSDATTNIAVEIDFSNYQAVGGVQVPFGIQMRYNGSLLFNLTIQSAALNSGLTAAAFSPN